MLTSDGSEAVALEAFKRGVTDYVVTSGGRLSDLTERVRPLLEAA